MTEISQIRLPNNELYDLKDNTHEVELPLNFYKNGFYAGQIDSTENANPQTKLCLMTDMNLQATSYNNSANTVKAGVYFYGKNNNDESVWGSRLALAEGTSNGRVATYLSTRKYDTSGNAITNNFIIAVDPDGESHYAVTSPFNFRSDISTSSQIKTVGNLSSTVSVSTATNTNIRQLTLTPGLWIVHGGLGFATNTTGVRVIKLSTTSADTANTISTMAIPPNPSQWTRITTSQAFYIGSGGGTVYLIAYQNSGSTLNCQGVLTATLV